MACGEREAVVLVSIELRAVSCTHAGQRHLEVGTVLEVHLKKKLKEWKNGLSLFDLHWGVHTQTPQHLAAAKLLSTSHNHQTLHT